MRTLLRRAPPAERRSEYRWPVGSGIDSPVPWILGAIVASRRSDIDSLGGWPEDFFLYFEDTELSLRAWDRGLEVWILGTMRWTHFWNRESRSLLSKAARLHMRSAVHFYANRPRLLIGAPFRVPTRTKTDET